MPDHDIKMTYREIKNDLLDIKMLSSDDMLSQNCHIII